MSIRTLGRVVAVTATLVGCTSSSGEEPVATAEGAVSSIAGLPLGSSWAQPFLSPDGRSIVSINAQTLTWTDLATRRTVVGGVPGETALWHVRDEGVLYASYDRTSGAYLVGWLDWNGVAHAPSAPDWADDEQDVHAITRVGDRAIAARVTTTGFEVSIDSNRAHAIRTAPLVQVEGSFPYGGAVVNADGTHVATLAYGNVPGHGVHFAAAQDGARPTYVPFAGGASAGEWVVGGRVGSGMLLTTPAGLAFADFAAATVTPVSSAWVHQDNVLVTADGAVLFIEGTYSTSGPWALKRWSPSDRTGAQTLATGTGQLNQYGNHRRRYRGAGGAFERSTFTVDASGKSIDVVAGGILFDAPNGTHFLKDGQDRVVCTGCKIQLGAGDVVSASLAHASGFVEDLATGTRTLIPRGGSPRARYHALQISRDGSRVFRTYAEPVNPDSLDRWNVIVEASPADGSAFQPIARYGISWMAGQEPELVPVGDRGAVVRDPGTGQIYLVE